MHRSHRCVSSQAPPVAGEQREPRRFRLPAERPLVSTDPPPWTISEGCVPSLCSCCYPRLTFFSQGANTRGKVLTRGSGTRRRDLRCGMEGPRGSLTLRRGDVYSQRLIQGGCLSRTEIYRRRNGNERDRGFKMCAKLREDRRQFGGKRSCRNGGGGRERSNPPRCSP